MRATRLFKFLIVATAALALAACPDRTAPLAVKVIKPSDSGVGPDPLEGAAFVRVRVTDVSNDNIVVEHKVDVGAGKVDLSGLPSGRPLRVQITALNSSEWTVSTGTSAPFTLPDTIEGSAPTTEVKVFLRAVEKWSPIVPASDPGSRTALFLPRAGHTATLLDDGRVLIAGGFQAANKNSASWKYLPSVEIFDPATGELTTEYPDMEYQGVGVTPRAFHTATKLPDGQVLFSGGEATEGAPAKMTTVFSSLLFDPAKPEDPWAPVPTTKKPRSRHTATLEMYGRVLLFGGIDWADGNVANFTTPFEWYDSQIQRFSLATLDQNYPTGRVGHSGLALGGGQFIAVAGGAILPTTSNTPALAVEDSVRFFRYVSDGDRVVAAGNPVAIDPPRSWAAVAEIGTSRLLVLGGFTGLDSNEPWDLFPTDPYSGSDVISTRLSPIRRDPAATVSRQGEGGRGHICAVTLRDGRVLAIGGRGLPDRNNPTRIESMNSTTFYRDEDNTIKGFARDGGNLLQPRFLHTCTVLADGSVLAVGGLLEQGSNLTTIDSLEIFVPSPDEE